MTCSAPRPWCCCASAAPARVWALPGEWSGAALVATENAPADKRALFGSFPNLGAPIGFFCAYGVNLLLDTLLPADAMVAWGWRVPFLLSCLLVIVGLVVRMRMSETPVFQKAAAENRTTKTPLRDLVRHWRRLVLGTCTMSITYTLFYVLGTWSLSYGVSTLGFTQQQYLGMQMISVFFFAGFILVGCLTADKRGRKPSWWSATCAPCCSPWWRPMLLSAHSVLSVMVFLCVGFAAWARSSAPAAATCRAVPCEGTLFRSRPELQSGGHHRRRVARPSHRPGHELRHPVARLVPGRHGPGCPGGAGLLPRKQGR